MTDLLRNPFDFYCRDIRTSCDADGRGLHVEVHTVNPHFSEGEDFDFRSTAAGRIRYAEVTTKRLTRIARAEKTPRRTPDTSESVRECNHLTGAGANEFPVCFKRKLNRLLVQVTD